MTTNYQIDDKGIYSLYNQFSYLPSTTRLPPYRSSNRSFLKSFNRYFESTMRLQRNVKCGWRKIGEIEKFYRSAWEANYARYLEYLRINGHIKSWKHEPKTFWFNNIKRGTRSYLPDFQVFRLDGTHYWIEVKGYMDAKSKTKIKRFRKYYPDEELQIKDFTWFKENSRKISILCPGWE